MERESFDFDTKRHLGLAKKTRTDAKDRDAIDNLSYAYGIEDVVKCLESYFKSSGILDLYKDMYIEITPFKSVSYNGYSLYLNPYGMCALIHEETPIRIHIVANDGYDQYIYYSNRKKEIVYFNSTVLSDKDLGNYIANRKMAEARYEFPIIQDPDGSDPDSMSVKVIHKIGEFMKDAVIKRFGVNESDLGLAKKTRQQAEDKDTIDNVNFIHFEDPEVERVCHEHGVYTYEDARKVTDMYEWFIFNSKIETFDELKYFRNVQNLDTTFRGCVNLREVTIPGVAAATSHMFFNCSYLSRVTIEEGFSNFDDFMFYGCQRLKEITLPKSTVFIADKAFAYTNIVDLFIPDYIELMASKSLIFMYYLKHVSLPCKDLLAGDQIAMFEIVRQNTVKSACTVFSYREKPTEVYESYNSLGLAKKARTIAGEKDEIDNVGIITPEDPVVAEILHRFNIRTYEDAARVTDINGWFKYKKMKKFNELKFFTGIKSTYGMFEGCEMLESVTIPMNVENIGDETFFGCSALREVKIESKKIRSIGYKAFMDCTSLKHIDLPESLESISSCSFRRSGIESIDIPDRVYNIGDRAFSRCEDLLRVKLPRGLKSFGDTDHDVFQGTSPVEVVYDKSWYDIEVNRAIQTNLNNCCYQVKFYDGDK